MQEKKWTELKLKKKKEKKKHMRAVISFATLINNRIA